MKNIVERIGVAGVAAIGLLAAALFFSNFMVKPLEQKNLSLTEAATRQGRKADSAQSGEKVAAVYEYLRKEEDTTDWLAKLHGIGTATGIQMRTASYRTQPTEGRIVRYEIVLPVTGSYGQIRDFLKRARAEIPVMSIDQVTLKKEEKKGGSAPRGDAPHPPHGEVMKLSLHLSPWKKNAAIIAAARHRRRRRGRRPGTTLDGDHPGEARNRRPTTASTSASCAAARPPCRRPIRSRAASASRKRPRTPRKPRRRTSRRPRRCRSSTSAASPRTARPRCYVMRGEELITLAPGQKIGDYRVEQIADASISFTYLPLKMKQTLDLQ